MILNILARFLMLCFVVLHMETNREVDSLKNLTKNIHESEAQQIKMSDKR